MVFCTYEVFPGQWVIGLPPGSRPAHQDRVVLHAAQTGGLNEVGDSISEVGGHHNVTETLGAFRRHCCLDVLKKQ